MFFCRIPVDFHPARYIGEPALPGGDSLWPGPLRGVPLRLLEALLDTMEGARRLTPDQGVSGALQPRHGALDPAQPGAAATRVHGRGPAAPRPP